MMMMMLLMILLMPLDSNAISDDEVLGSLFSLRHNIKTGV